VTTSTECRPCVILLALLFSTSLWRWSNWVLESITINTKPILYANLWVIIRNHQIKICHHRSIICKRRALTTTGRQEGTVPVGTEHFYQSTLSRLIRLCSTYRFDFVTHPISVGNQSDLMFRRSLGKDFHRFQFYEDGFCCPMYCTNTIMLVIENGYFNNTHSSCQ